MRTFVLHVACYVERAVLKVQNKKQEGVKRDTSDSYLILRGLSAVQVDATRDFGMWGTV